MSPSAERRRAPAGFGSPAGTFLLLTLIPAAILAFLGWNGSGLLLDEVVRTAGATAARVHGDVLRELPERVRALDQQAAADLRAVAGELTAALPFSMPGEVLARFEARLGAALVVRTEGNQLLPAGPRPTSLEHLPEWPTFCEFRHACDRNPDCAPVTFAAPTLQAMAIAMRHRLAPDRAAELFAGLDLRDVAAAGPLACEVLAGSVPGRAMLAELHRRGLLAGVPATETARLAWLQAAGVQGPDLAHQQLRARGERGEPGDVHELRAATADRVQVVQLRDLRPLAAALSTVRDGCQIACAFGAGAALPPEPREATVTGAVTTAWGPLSVTVAHRELPAILADAARQRWLSGLGVVLLLASMVAGTALVRRALRRERRARVLRDEFIANVSHELKTPLTGLRLHAEMLSGDAVDAQSRRRYGDVAQAEGARLSALVEDLLDFAALERGGRRLEPEPMDLGAAAAAAVAAWAPRAVNEQVALEHVPHGESVALVDAIAAGRILTNLLQNAFRHGRPPRNGEPRCIRVLTGPGPRLAVHNNGPAIPVADRERIFERFERAGDGPGMGLGLSLSRQLATLSGGRLSCADDGHETMFVLELPPAPDLGDADEHA